MLAGRIRLHQTSLVPLKRSLAVCVLALTLAATASVRLGAQALAFDLVGTDGGLTMPAHSVDGAIQCSPGVFEIRYGTLWVDAAPTNSKIKYVRYDVTLYRWDATLGWQVVRDGARWVWDLNQQMYVHPYLADPQMISEMSPTGATSPNHWLIFYQLPSGYYTVSLRFSFLDGFFNSLVGKSTWSPALSGSDFFPSQGHYYCQI
jgi:hypothetical protein